MSQPQSYQEVSVTEVPAGAYIIDVREDHEYAEDHIAGAVHIPMAQIPARLAEIDLEQDIYLACKAGGRSAQVAQYLVEAQAAGQISGSGAIINIAGGTDAWRSAGLAMEQ